MTSQATATPALASALAAADVRLACGDTGSDTDPDLALPFHVVDDLLSHLCHEQMTMAADGTPVPAFLTQSIDRLRAYANAALDRLLSDTLGCPGIIDLNDADPVTLTDDAVVICGGSLADAYAIEVYLPQDVTPFDAAGRAIDLVHDYVETLTGFELDLSGLSLAVHRPAWYLLLGCRHDDHEWHPVQVNGPEHQGANLITRVTLERA